MSDTTKIALRAAEERVALALAAVTQQTAKREEAQAALEAIEQKRRTLARASFLGTGGDAKAARAAANARDDAQKLVEDVGLMIDEAARFLAEARVELVRCAFKDHWSDVMVLGRQRAEALERIITARDALYAAVADFRTIGQDARAHANKARVAFPRGGYGVSPEGVCAFVRADVQKAAAVIADTMPHEIFAVWPNLRGAAWSNVLENERAFWDGQEIDEEFPVSALSDGPGMAAT